MLGIKKGCIVENRQEHQCLIFLTRGPRGQRARGRPRRTVPGGDGRLPGRDLLH